MTGFEREVLDRLARIEAHVERTAGHEPRIAALEKSRDRIIASAAMVTAIIGSTFGYILKKLGIDL